VARRARNTGGGTVKETRSRCSDGSEKRVVERARGSRRTVTTTQTWPNGNTSTSTRTTWRQRREQRPDPRPEPRPIVSDNDASEVDDGMDDGMGDPRDDGMDSGMDAGTGSGSDESPSDSEPADAAGPGPAAPADDPPVVAEAGVHPQHPVDGSQYDRSRMRMAGQVEYDAFVTQNEIRGNPTSFVDDVEAEIAKFRNSRQLVQDNGVILNTNEGIGAWREAARVLAGQGSFAPLEWNDYLALAAEDHCDDQGPRGATGHYGSDRSSPFDRISRYGTWGGSAAENLAYGGSDGGGFMLQLYIDDGVADRGHRHAMLNPALKLVGMHHCQHRGYGGMLAVAYAVSFTPSAHGERQLDARALN